MANLPFERARKVIRAQRDQVRQFWTTTNPDKNWPLCIRALFWRPGVSLPTDLGFAWGSACRV